MFLFNHNRLLRDINAFLGTFGIAQFAADTLVCHKITGFLCLYAAERKAGPVYRKSGKVEPFTGSLINFEHGKGAAGACIGINLFHVCIFAEQVRQFIRPDLFCFALYGYGHAGKSIFPFHCGKGDIFIGF